jgi:hypothetical protein
MRPSPRPIHARAAIAGAILLLAGCAETWTKPGAMPQEFDAAQAACAAKANAAVPPNRQEVQMSPGYVTPMQMRCSGAGAAANCYPAGGQYVAPATTTVDRNQNLRRTVIRECLTEGGWRPAKGAD